MTMLIRSTTLGSPVVDGRTIFGLCVPFNRPTIVADEPGKFYQEQFVPGAFTRAMNVPHRVHIQFGHGRDDIVRAGKAARFTEEADGLYGEFIADETPIGEALIARARSEEPVGLSIGAVALKTEKRGAVITRTSVHLDHVAATNSAAYKDARVLAVRAVDDTRTLAYWLDRYADLLRAP
jgi:HK97 family phage prohead protease